ERRRRSAGAPIDEMDLAVVAGPALRGDHRPAIVGADGDHWDHFLLLRRLEDQRIDRLWVPEAMEVDPAEILFVPGRDLARRGKPQVVETAAVGGPCDTGELDAREAICEGAQLGCAADGTHPDLLAIAPVHRQRAGDPRAVVRWEER